MLETAGILDVHAAGTLMAAVERSAHGQRDPLEGIYKCLQKNGVGIRAQPQESTKRLHGPAYGALIAVEGVRVCKVQLAQPEVTESKVCTSRHVPLVPELALTPMPASKDIVQQMY